MSSSTLGTPSPSASPVWQKRSFQVVKVDWALLALLPWLKTASKTSVSPTPMELTRSRQWMAASALALLGSDSEGSAEVDQGSVPPTLVPAVGLQAP